MRALIVATVFAFAAGANAQGAAAVEPIVDAYRAGAVFERVVFEAPRGAAPPARSEAMLAIRPGEEPAIALALGADDPLRILAEPGRLYAWRQSDPARVYVAPLGEPFGRAAIERVLPPLLMPQIDLAFAAEPGALLAVMPELTWTLVARGEQDRYAGVALGAALSLTVDAEHRLLGFEVQRDGHVLARAAVTRLEADPEVFLRPELSDLPVASLADLGQPPGPARVGDVFGQALGFDAAGRPTTLRTIATYPAMDPANVVVLAVDARRPEARARLAGALAEADLARLAELLGVRIVVLALGEPQAAATLERVIEQPAQPAPPIRALAIDAAPAWLDAGETGTAYAIHERSWVLVARHDVAAEQADAEPEQAVPIHIDRPDSPWHASTPPRTLAERLTEAVGSAGRALD